MKKEFLILGVLILMLIVANQAYAVIGIDNYTVLMPHFNGADGSINFIESSLSDHAVTANGDAQIDTAEKKFGTGSVQFDGNGDYLTISDSDDWYFGEGNFTIDFWVRFADTTHPQYIWSQGTDGSQYTRFGWNGSGFWYGDINIIPGPEMAFTASDAGISPNTWHHVALVKSGSDDWHVFRDGVGKVVIQERGLPPIPNYIGPATVGCLNYNIGQTEFFNGYIDELRVSKGTARWTENFTPPTSEYTPIPEPSTLVLLSFGLFGLIRRRFKA